MVTSLSNPYIKIIKYNDVVEYPIINQGKKKRPLFDESVDGAMYNCDPMSVANIHGWDFTLPHDVVVQWDGVMDDDLGHMSILEGELYNGEKVVSSDSGMGIVTFFFNCFVETDKDHYLLLNGPSNYSIEGTYPLNAIWRSDYYNYYQLFFCWKVTKSNEPVLFKKGTTVMSMINYPKNLLESTNIQITSLDLEPKIKKDSLAYAKKQLEFALKNPQTEYPRKLAQFYKKGIGPNDEVFLECKFNPKLKEPVN